ncbi:hypothetical protein [Streptomyces peucetius]|uniref:Uncharacterized protein n=1 Tax=Streptomyces peucetius TaxID=1950 RepID=A0ABY6I7J0_STRPE|nr:hypothetical protein [Streptomyces peucetius]UYQ62954.1 hypothetical protein OGH68_16660 [Streptomyces peucetius]
MERVVAVLVEVQREVELRDAPGPAKTQVAEIRGKTQGKKNKKK